MPVARFPRPLAAGLATPARIRQARGEGICPAPLDAKGEPAIFEKHGAANRTQATARARDLGRLADAVEPPTNTRL